MRDEVIIYSDPKSPVSEMFKTLRTNIQFMNLNRKIKTLLITSTLPGEGKSWVAANLAATFAEIGKNVVIVDADMRKGRQYAIFETAPKPGLSNYLSGFIEKGSKYTSVDTKNIIKKTEIENLQLIPAGNIPPNPSELLVSTRMMELLNELEIMYDIVILDGTPSELVTDAFILSRMVDYTLIVTESGKTKKDSLKRIVNNIQNINGKIAGIIINKIPTTSKRYEDLYYYSSSMIESKKTKNEFHNKKEKRNIKLMK